VPVFGPIKRKDLICSLRQSGFEGPYSGGRHQFMVKGEIKLYIPNPHRGDISRGLLAKILRQAGIERDEWAKL
jgi:predicted RNA binding protein YcfA (HicA-like mRNA interferase family)